MTPRTFRKTIATIFADEIGMEAAAEQLGHTSPEITRRHCVQRKLVTSDVRTCSIASPPFLVGFPWMPRKAAPPGLRVRPSDLLFSVELWGIEPQTYSMRTSRATNCAIAPGGHRATNRKPL